MIYIQCLIEHAYFYQRFIDCPPPNYQNGDVCRAWLDGIIIQQSNKMTSPQTNSLHIDLMFSLAVEKVGKSNVCLYFVVSSIPCNVFGAEHVQSSRILEVCSSELCPQLSGIN